MQRRDFGREFKLEAVKLVRERGLTTVLATRDLNWREPRLSSTCTQRPVGVVKVPRIFLQFEGEQPDFIRRPGRSLQQCIRSVSASQATCEAGSQCRSFAAARSWTGHRPARGTSVRRGTRRAVKLGRPLAVGAPHRPVHRLDDVDALGHRVQRCLGIGQQSPAQRLCRFSCRRQAPMESLLVGFLVFASDDIASHL